MIRVLKVYSSIDNEPRNRKRRSSPPLEQEDQRSKSCIHSVRASGSPDEEEELYLDKRKIKDCLISDTSDTSVICLSSHTEATVQLQPSHPDNSHDKWNHLQLINSLTKNYYETTKWCVKMWRQHSGHKRGRSLERLDGSV